MHFCMFVPWVLKKQTIIRLLLPNSNPSALRIYAFTASKATEEKIKPQSFWLWPFQNTKITKRHRKIMLHSSFPQFLYYFEFILPDVAPLDVTPQQIWAQFVLPKTSMKRAEVSLSLSLSLSLVILSKDKA